MKKLFTFAFISLCVLFYSNAFAGPAVYSRGQTVYVPGAHTNLTPYATYEGSALYVRNVNSQASQGICLTSVAFYGPDGELVKEFLKKPVRIGPLASERFLASTETLGIEPYPMDGGEPSWVVHWIVDQNTTAWVLEPIVEVERYILREDASGSEIITQDWTRGTMISGSVRVD